MTFSKYVYQPPQLLKAFVPTSAPYGICMQNAAKHASLEPLQKPPPTTWNFNRETSEVCSNTQKLRLHHEYSSVFLWHPMANQFLPHVERNYLEGYEKIWLLHQYKIYTSINSMNWQVIVFLCLSASQGVCFDACSVYFSEVELNTGCAFLHLIWIKIHNTDPSVLVGERTLLHDRHRMLGLPLISYTKSIGNYHGIYTG